jgi:ATP-dependent RNA helicase DBP3
VVEVIEDRARDARLHELLQQYHKSRSNRVIVFVLYKKEAVRVEQLLQRKGWKVRLMASAIILTADRGR